MKMLIYIIEVLLLYPYVETWIIVSNKYVIMLWRLWFILEVLLETILVDMS